MVSLDVFVFIIFIFLFRFLFFLIIQTLTEFVYLDVSILLTFLIFCISDFIYSCKPYVDKFSKPYLSYCHNKVSSHYSPDRKNPSFQSHAWDDACWSVGRQQSQNWSRGATWVSGRFSGWEKGGFWDFQLLFQTTPTKHFTNWCDQLGSSIQTGEWGQHPTTDWSVRQPHKLVRPNLNHKLHFTNWWLK